MRKRTLALLGGFFLQLTLGSLCLADSNDIRALEDRAAQRVLGHFVQALKQARNVVVHPNNLLTSDHLEEETNYCNALLDAAKKRNGDGITVPAPDMSTGRDGNPAVFEYIRERTASCPSDRWMKEGIPATLLLHPEYPRLFSTYELKGSNPWTVVLERRFYDDRYNDIQSVQWVYFFPNACYSVGGNSTDFPRGDPVENHVQAGVLQFAGKMLFYQARLTDYSPRSRG